MAMLVSFYMPYKVSTFLIYVIHVMYVVENYLINFYVNIMIKKIDAKVDLLCTQSNNESQG